ncbi:MAG: outer membrane beta-barrel protein, partial [Alphaproteobacteria bacterium]|nr:outer membrane beta-barrel protein [Alphaproteobacteria bacterium]
MKKALLCATAAATLVSVGATAHAQEGWYGAARLGVVVEGIVDIDAPRNVNGSLDDRGSMNADATYGVGLGYGFTNGIRLQTDVNYANIGLDIRDAFIGARPAGRVGPDGKGSVRSTTLMVNAIKDFNRGGTVMPYLGVGAGAIRADVRAASLYFSGTGQPANGFDDSDTTWAYNALAGLGFKLSERLTADIGYTYTGADDLNFNAGVDGPYTGSFSEHAVTAGVRW